MPNIKSAEKRVRQTKTRTLQNRLLKGTVKTYRKKVRAAVAGGDKSGAEESLRLFASAIDKASKRNVFHKSTASRQKSRLALQIKGMEA